MTEPALSSQDGRPGAMVDQADGVRISSGRPTLTFAAVDPARHPEQHPDDIWSVLRARHPVAWCEAGPAGTGFWVVSRYHDIMTAYRQSARLSSQRGNVVATMAKGRDPAAGRMLVVTDPPRHTEMRRVVQSAFTASAMSSVVTAVAGATRDLVTELVRKGSGDFAAEVAAQIPAMAMCELFAVPAGDRPRLLALTATAMGSDTTPRTAAETAAAKRELLQYYADLLPARRSAPGTDLVSVMAAGVNGITLSTAEIVLNCYNVVIGADETSRFASAGAVLALTRHPDQWTRLLEDPLVLDTAVEEILRWTTPATHVARAATGDLTLGGVTITEGDVVTLWNSSANRDEEVFRDPYRLDLGRTPNRHLALGHGPHFCVGAPLARAELRHLLAELREQIDRIELTGPVRRIQSDVLAGISQLPVRVTPRRRRGVGTAT